MPNINSLTYNGTKSTDLGVYVTGSGSFDAAEMDADKYEIAGRNGDLIIQKNRFKNIVVTYPAFIPKAFQEKAQSIRNWMRSAKAYARLEDTYDMEHYRLGLASGIQSFEPVNRNDASNFQLSFDCKPQRFLKTGETPLPIEPEAHSYSGEIVEFETVAVDDMTKAEVSFSPKQDGTPSIESGVNNAPYLFRPTGATAECNYEVDKIVGGTIAWNQFAGDGVLSLGTSGQGLTITTNDVTFTKNEDGSVSISGTQSGRAYVYDNSISGRGIPVSYGDVILLTASGTSNVPIGIGGSFYAGTTWQSGFNSFNLNAKVGTLNKVPQGVNWVSGVAVDSKSANDGQTITAKVYANLFNITKMFGSTIADYIYALETANAGAGVAWFRKLFPKPYYAYNAGELMSVQTSAHKMVGFNSYDNTTGKAKVVGGNQYQITGTFTALSLDGETITPDASGYFTPSASGEITVTGGNGTDTCIHLVWDGERDGEYEEYKQWVYPLDSDLVLRGIPKLSSGNDLYYDGDVYESDGTVTRKYGIRAYQSGDETDGATMITDGTNTVYALATPTTESADPYQNPQVADKWGTEEYVDSRTVPIPAGHMTQYGMQYAITGRTGAVLKIGAEYPTADREYTATFGQTVYGGTFDFVSGYGQSKWANIASYNGETLPGIWLSDRDVYAPGTTPTIGAQVVYELATPIEIDLDPTEVQTLLGLNNVWASDGTVEINYADPFNVNNPTYFEARPLFEITNPAQNDVLTVNGKTITFRSSYTGTVTIDCETMDCYAGYSNMNYLIEATDFPVLGEGTSIVTWSGSGECKMIPRWWEL